jgi:hypothetical protein
MRKPFAVLTVASLLLVWVGIARSDDESDARAIVTKAIKATGGEAAIAKHKSATFKEKGLYFGMGGDGLPYTASYAVELPSKFRMDVEGLFLMIVNGDKGWTKMGDQTKEMTKEELAAQQMTLKAEWMGGLLPLQDKAFTLATLPEIKIDDKAAVGVKATRKDYPDLKLYFDKNTNLLVRLEFRTKDAQENFKDVTMEANYSNFKEFDGMKIPTKMVIKKDGKRFVEADVLEYKAVEKIDPKMFDRP